MLIFLFRIVITSLQPPGAANDPPTGVQLVHQRT